jgi:hypothetical protein
MQRALGCDAAQDRAAADRIEEAVFLDGGRTDARSIAADREDLSAEHLDIEAAHALQISQDRVI